MRRWLVRGAVAAAGLAWMAFALWTFSFAYSSSFFLYNRPSRLPVLAAAWFGACAIPASAILQWRRGRGPMVACLRHSAGILVALAPLIVVLLLLHRAPDPWRPSADDALGAGIDLLLLCGLGLVSILALAVALLVRAALERRRRGAIS